jgi:hypothetical protein
MSKRSTVPRTILDSWCTVDVKDFSHGNDFRETKCEERCFPRVTLGPNGVEDFGLASAA